MQARQKKTPFGRENPCKIIFIALNGIGNLILLTPVFENIKKNLPKSTVHVLALKDSAGVLENNPYVDEVITYPAKGSLSQRIKFLFGIRRKRYDISFYPYPNVSIMSAVIAFFIGAKCRVNFEYGLFGREVGFLDTVSVKVDFEKHDVEKNLDLIRALGMKVYSKKIIVPSSKSDKNQVNRLLNGKSKKSDFLIGMHVGSKEGMRIWPTENFAQIAGELSKLSNLKILLFGTGIENYLIKDFEQFNGKNIINLIKKTTISQTTEAISRCRLFITTDSGPMHMAVAAGTKVIAIYLGPHIRRTSPFGDEHIVFVQKQACYDDFYGKYKNKNHIYCDDITSEMLMVKIMENLP